MSRYVPFSIGERVVIDDIDCVFDGCVKAPAGSADDDDLVFVDRRTGSRHVFTRQEFDDAYGAGRFRFLKPYERIDDVAPEPDRGDYEKARRRRLWCEAADAAGVARSTKALTAFIAATAPAIPDPNPPSAGSLRRWMSERGFVEDRRPRFMGDRTPRGPREMRVHPMVQRILADGLAEYADKGVRVNQRSVHHKCRAAVIALNAERERQGLPLLDAPSKATVHRYIRAREDREVMVKRWGAKVGGKPFDPIRGAMDAKRILDVMVIDHTPIDCDVIDDEKRVNVGQPYLTMGIDAASRYPMGFYLGWEPPSVFTAMACLRHCVKPKTAEAAAYPDVRHPWAAFGVPNTIVCDNAWEFTKSSFPEACREVNISVVYAAIGDPGYKGIGERFFETLNDLVIHRMQGSRPFTPQMRKEMGIDPDREAVMFLSDLRELIYQAIVEIYGRRPHSTIGAAPEKVWREQAAKWGTFYASDLAALEASLTQVEERTLTRDGIQLFNLTYRSEAELGGLLADLLPGGRSKGSRTGPRVKIKFDPADIGRIWVFNPKRNTYVQLPCTKPAYAMGKSVHYHRELGAWARKINLAFESEDEMSLAHVRLQDKIDDRILTNKIRDRRRDQRLKERIDEPQAIRITEVDPDDHSQIAIGGLSNITGNATPSRRQRGPKRGAGKAKPAPSRVLEAKLRNPYEEMDFGGAEATGDPAFVYGASQNPYGDMDFGRGVQ